MTRVYVGNLDPRVTERELEDEFRTFGVIRGVWVARRPPGYAFIDFDDRRDAVDAIRELEGKNGWRVELSHNSRGGGGSRGGGRFRDHSSGSDLKCYECGESGHFARECRLRVGSGGAGSGRKRSRSPYSPRYRRSPSYGGRSPSPRDRSPRRRNGSPSRRRSVSPRRRSVSPARHRSVTPPRCRSPSSRRRSPSPRRRSPSPPRHRSISPRKDHSISSPRRVSHSPRDRSASPPRRSNSKSPQHYCSGENSPYTNGKVAADGEN